MKAKLLGYLGCLVCFLLMDAIWLGYLAKQIYLTAMEGRLRETYPMWPWVSFYLAYNVAIMYLVVWPQRRGLPYQAVLGGAVLGAASYGAYNMTNYAILAGWPLHISLIDLSWGIVVTACSALCGFLVVRKFQSDFQS
jgi:uncharacterized membrane protein